MKIKVSLLALLAASAPCFAAAWDEFLDGSVLPDTPPWSVFQDGLPDESGDNVIIDFTDPADGQPNQAIQINSGTGANEWYIGPFDFEERAAGARFRVTAVSPTGKENLFCLSTRSKHLAPAPALTLVDGRFKLWNYVIADSELLDIGPVDLDVFHTIYLYARSDGLVKCWWDGKLIFDGMAPLVNPYDGYFEWGSGSWQFDARDSMDFDWIGFGAPTELPLSVTTTPAFGAIFADAAQGWKATIVSQPGLAPGVAANGITLTVNGADRTSDLVISGDNAAREVAFNKLATNQIYKVVLTVKDVNGTTSLYPFEFDTFATNSFTFEAEDFNFDGGSFFDDIVLSSFPADNSYFGRFGADDIDKLELSMDFADGTHTYRSDDLVGTENSRDTLRQNFIDAQANDPGVADYNISSVEPTEWLNYTRTFPSGDYNIYARMASPSIDTPFSATLSRVTDPTLPTQTAAVLGSFQGATGRGSQNYEFIPLTDAQGKLVRVTLNGLTTLRVTADTPLTANFYLLAPAAAELPALSIVWINKEVAVSWQGAGFTLESSDRIDGGWQTVAGSPNPYQIAPTATHQFFRLKQ